MNDEDSLAKKQLIATLVSTYPVEPDPHFYRRVPARRAERPEFAPRGDERPAIVSRIGAGLRERPLRERRFVFPVDP